MDVVLSKSERETLKAVYRLTKGGSDAHTGALAEHLGVAPGTVTTTVKRLAERELVDHRPYKGVELVRRYSQPAEHRHSIQLEINRKLYMSEETFELNEGYEALKSSLRSLVDVLLATDPRKL